MNTSFKTIFFCCVFSYALFFSKRIMAQDDVVVNFQVFYNELSPYGTWVNSPQYGYVWIPSVDENFQPYSTNGYWLLTGEGWTWVSNYAWGWAPFHYGRWYNDEIYGAVWMPDNEWGPGWVNWRQNDDYYGWCAMSPNGSIFIASNDDWTFVHSNHFGHQDWHEHAVNKKENIAIINTTTIINNTRADGFHHERYNGGPDRMQVEHTTGEKLMPIVIIDDSKHETIMNNNELHLYRPSVEKNNTIGAKPAPAKVSEMRDVKPNEKRRNEIASHITNELKQTDIDASKKDVAPIKKQSTIPIQQNRIPAAKPLLQKNKPVQNDVPMHQFPHQNNTPEHQQSKPAQHMDEPRNNDGKKQVPHSQPPLPPNDERQNNNLQPHQ